MEPIPQSPAKAAAFDRWLAQGGNTSRRTGKFKTGPMKGMTYDQAAQKFEGMWAGSSPAIKDKYARLSQGGGVAPSEAAPVKPESPSQMYSRQRESRMNHYKRLTPATPAPANPAATSGAGRGTPIKQIGTPAEQAKVAQMVKEGEGYATAGYGQWGGMGDTAMYSAIAMGRAREKAAAINPQTAAEVKAIQDKESAGPKAASQDAAVKRIVADVSASRSAAGLPAMSPEEIMRSRQQPATPQPAPAAADAPAPQQPAPAPAPAIPSISAPTGATIGRAPRINSLTGLPMGYMPGDATDGMNPEMKARADASTARMKSVAPPPRAIPVVQPVRPPTVEQRAADEMRRQAAINANPSRTNPDDPRKFFTGKVKPLDQLVAGSRPAYR